MASMLVIENHHYASCGEPPVVRESDDCNLYIGYFCNRHGDQWIFSYDRTAKQGTLRGGDVEWPNAIVFAERPKMIPLADGPMTSVIVHPGNIILGADEFLWLQACWTAATREPLPS